MNGATLTVELGVPEVQSPQQEHSPLAAVSTGPVRRVDALIIAAMTAVLVWPYGLFPGLQSLPMNAWAQTNGFAACFREQGQLIGGNCLAFGTPVGVRPLLALPVFVFARMTAILGIGASASMALFGIALLALGVAGLYRLALLLTRSRVAAPVAVGVYFLAPFIVGHRFYFDMFFGFLLLPFAVYSSLAVALADPRKGRWTFALRLLVCFGANGMLVFLSAYPYVVGVVLSACVLAALAVQQLWRRDWLGCGSLALTAAAILTPAALYSSKFGPGADQAETSLDFFRGQGVDLVSVFVPTRAQFAGKLIWAPVGQWLPSSFFGDGSNVAWNFVGIVTFGSACVGLYLLLRRSGEGRALRVGLVVGGLVCAILALGPSLKIDDRRAAVAGPLSHASYFMTEHDARLTLPWDDVFRAPIVKNMRGVYRWQVGARLIGALGVAVVAAALLGKRRYAILAVILGLVAVETLGTAVAQGGSAGQKSAEYIRDFRHDAVQPIDRATRDGERVLFLPAENDYLIPSLAAPIGITTYNADFDKELPRVRAGQPPQVVAAIAAYNTGMMSADDLAVLFDRDLVDAVVLLDFNLRASSFAWPPSSASIDSYRAKASSLALEQDPRFSLRRHQLFTVVREAGSGSDAG